MCRGGTGAEGGGRDHTPYPRASQALQGPALARLTLPHLAPLCSGLPAWSLLRHAWGSPMALLNLFPSMLCPPLPLTSPNPPCRIEGGNTRNTLRNPSAGTLATTITNGIYYYPSAGGLLLLQQREEEQLAWGCTGSYSQSCGESQ